MKNKNIIKIWLHFYNLQQYLLFIALTILILETKGSDQKYEKFRKILKYQWGFIITEQDLCLCDLDQGRL